MHSFIFFKVAIFTLLAGSAFGETGFWSMLRIFKRQSQAFQPSTDLTPTCDANQLQCGPEPTPTCYTPSLGDVCCNGGYACPGGSFCLTAGFCCPNGLSPESCAQQFSVTLPPGFNTNPQSASATSPPSSSPTSSQVTTSSTVVTTGKNVTFTATPTTSTPSQFTGAASHQKTIGGIAAILLGVAGLVGHVL